MMNTTECLELLAKHGGYIARETRNGNPKLSPIAMKKADGSDIVVTDSLGRQGIPIMPFEMLEDLCSASLIFEDRQSSTPELRVYKLTEDGRTRGR
jgi:hypothetical protein